jgi:glycosyltransferase involved in cell wall biosynthesis
MQPLISVLIPSYNHKAYIEQCIDSVFAQNFKELEVIVIDDASTDGSQNKLEQLAKIHPLHLMLNEKNRGQAVTLNEALQIARGEYFCVLASDDLFLPGKLQKQIEKLKSNPDAKMCYTLKKKIDASGAVLHEDNLPGPAGMVFEKLIFDNFICASSVMAHRETVIWMGGFQEGILIEDWDMWLRLCNRYPVTVVNEPLTAYRIHGSNVSRERLLEMMDCSLAILKTWEKRPEYKEALKLWCLRHAVCLSRYRPRQWRNFFYFLWFADKAKWKELVFAILRYFKKF